MTARMMHATIIIANGAASGILSRRGDQILQKLNTDPDDQLHRHQTDADAKHGPVVVDRHVACPAAPAKAQER